MTSVAIVRSRSSCPSVNKIAKSLSENGYQVDVIVWDRQRRMSCSSVGGYKISRFDFSAPQDRVAALPFLPMWWLFVLVSLVKKKPEIIHACDLDTLPPAILAKLLVRATLCYSIYDFYAGHLPDGPPIALRNAIRKSIAFVEKAGIEFAEILFLPDEKRSEQVEGARIKEVVYLFNTPPETYLTNKHNDHGVKSVLTLFYAGNLDKSRGLEYVVQAVREMNGVSLILAGIGPEKDFICHLISTNPTRIRYLGQIPYEKVIEYTEESSALAAFYDPSTENNRYASPNKLFEAMMCGKPIIMNSEISSARIVKEENCGLLVPYGDVPALKRAIGLLRDDEKLRETLGMNGRNAYNRKYSYSIVEGKLLDAYERVSARLSKRGSN